MSPEVEPSKSHSTAERPRQITYDVRKGAGGYASIVGGIGGIVVAGVVLVFTSTSSALAAKHPAEVTFVAGLFVLSLVGCLVGAFGFAGIASEEQQALNLPAAAMWVGAAVVLALVALMGGFEILADLYVRSSRGLFAFSTFGVGVGGAIYVSFTVGEDWDWSGDRSSFRSREHAYRRAKQVAAISIAPTVLGFLLYVLNLNLALSRAGTEIFVGGGIALTVVFGVGGSLRTMHSAKGIEHDAPMLPLESLVIPLVMSLYAGLLLVFLP